MFLHVGLGGFLGVMHGVKGVSFLPYVHGAPLFRDVRLMVLSGFAIPGMSYACHETSPCLVGMPTQADCRDCVVSEVEPVFAEMLILRGA